MRFPTAVTSVALALALALTTLACAAPAASTGSSSSSAASTTAPAASPAAPSSAPSAAASPPSAGAGAAAQAPASGQPLTPIRLLWVAKAANMAPAWVALDAGYFKEQGLDVKLSYVNGSPTGIAALVAGDADFLEAAGSAVVLAGAKTSGDKQPILVIGTVNTDTHKLMVTPSIKSLADLKGKKLCISTPGALDQVVLDLYLKKHGMTMQDVVPINGGSINGCVAEFAAHQVDGGVESTPATIAMQQAGAVVLADLAKEGIKLSQLGVAVTRGYAKAHPDTILRFTRAYIQGIYRFKTDKAFAEQEMSKYLGTTNQAQLDDAYTTYQTAFEEIPSPSKEAMQNAIDSTPSAKGEDVTKTYDTSFVDQVQKSGFISKLYGH